MLQQFRISTVQLATCFSTWTLYVASEGDMPPSPPHAGRFRISWTDLWIEFLKFTPIDAALHVNMVVRTVGSLKLFHDSFQRAVGDGLDFSSRGSMRAVVESTTRRVVPSSRSRSPTTRGRA